MLTFLFVCIIVILLTKGETNEHSKNDYDTETTSTISIQEFNEIVNQFNREIELTDIAVRVQYSEANPQDTCLSTLLSTIDKSKTIVMHFDSEFDIYITA